MNSRLFEETTASHVDAFIRCVGNAFKWAVFPWGGHSSMGLLAFVSRDVRSFRRFESLGGSNSPNLRTDVDWAGCVVSSYEFVDALTSVSRAAILVEDSPGFALWEAFDLNSNPPYLVFASPEAFEFHTDSAFEDPEWIAKQYDVIGAVDGSNDPEADWLYVPRNREALMLAARQASNAPAIIVSGTTPVDAIRVLSDRFKRIDSFQVLATSYLFAEVTDWALLTGRGHPDDRYSILVTQEPRVLTARLEMMRTLGSHIISLF
jgi:hypothetical protein